jgi:hypothetical protein
MTVPDRVRRPAAMALQPFPTIDSSQRSEIAVRGSAGMRSVVVILILCGLILLAFSPVWYETLAGQQQTIINSVETSFEIRHVAAPHEPMEA